MELLLLALLKWKGCELCFLHYHFLMKYSTSHTPYYGSNSDNTGFSRAQLFEVAMHFLHASIQHGRNMSSRCRTIFPSGHALYSAATLDAEPDSSGGFTWTHDAVDVTLFRADISVTVIAMDRDFYQKRMNTWLFVPWFLILEVCWNWM